LEQDKIEADFETFLRDLEEDPELRQSINLYKDSSAVRRPVTDMDDEDEDEEAPEVPLEELLEDLTIGGGDDYDDVDMA
ncbi:ribosome-binding protein, partial [Coemansia sp. S85]